MPSVNNEIDKLDRNWKDIPFNHFKWNKDERVLEIWHVRNFIRTDRVLCVSSLWPCNKCKGKVVQNIFFITYFEIGKFGKNKELVNNY